MVKEKLRQITVGLPNSTVEWLEDRVRDGTYASFAHGVRVAVEAKAVQWREENGHRVGGN